MVLLEKFVGVSRDAGMDGLLHKTRAIIMDYIVGFPHEKPTSSKSDLEQRSMYTNL